jgi:methyl-accepting chemotaxis protein
VGKPERDEEIGMFFKRKLRLKQELVSGLLLCGVIPALIVATANYTSTNRGASKLEQEAEVELKRSVNDRLMAVRDSKNAMLENYLNTIKGQVVSLSKDTMVIDAVTAFGRGASVFREELGLDESALDKSKKSVLTYYRDEFGRQYERQTGRSAEVNQFIARIDDDSIALQSAYIAENPNALGEKHQMDRAEADTAYNRVHGIYHPAIRAFLEEFGFYDVLLCDTHSGDVVYSVFKELDYSTSLIDGPFADSGLGEAFRRANTLGDSDFAIVDFKQYTPSYESPASTIASAVEEQSITTKYITDNVNQTASAAETVTKGVSESAQASQEITQNISRVDSVLRETANGAQDARDAGSKLSELAQQMNSIVGQFRTNDSAWDGENLPESVAI